MKNKTFEIAKCAIVSALYITLTLISAPLSFGAIQFRIAEMLILLTFYNKKFGYSIILGCLVSNIFSPLGFVDVVFGTLQTLISVLLIGFCKNIIVASLMPTSTMFIIALELNLVLGLPFWFSFLTCAIGEFCVLTVGVVIFKILERNKPFMEIIGAKKLDTQQPGQPATDEEN